MIYNHMVKVNGVYYTAGQDVPETNIKTTVEETQPSFSDSDIEFEERPEKKYTKTEINRMNTAELQQLAAEVGIENAYERSGNELKKVLAEHFGL